MIHKLINPFKDLGGVLRTELQVRDHLTAGDVLHARRSGAGDDFTIGLELIARVCGLDMKEVLSMDMRDVDVLDAHIGELRSPKAPADPATSAT